MPEQPRPSDNRPETLGAPDREPDSLRQAFNQDQPLRELLRFERLISNLSARFVNIPPEQIDSEIERGLQQLLEFFQIDRCGLLRAAPDSTTFQITHACVAEGIPPVPVGEDLSTALFPWAYQKVIIQHEVISVSALEDMPPEASVDTQTYREWGIRSHLNIPIVMTGSQDYIISINAVRSERAWPRSTSRGSASWVRSS